MSRLPPAPSVRPSGRSHEIRAVSRAESGRMRTSDVSQTDSNSTRACHHARACQRCWRWQTTRPSVQCSTPQRPGSRGRGLAIQVVQVRHGRHARRDRQESSPYTLAAPPAAAIFSRAEVLKACAVMVSATPPRSPVPSTLTGWPRRTAPASTSSFGPTSPPFGNSSASRSRLTTWKTTLNLLRKPLSFGRRMWRGICPPSNAAEMFLRAFDPLVPRPAVLPLEPSPRPTRVFSVLAPGAGRRWWILIAMVLLDLLDPHEVRHGPDHPPDFGTILLDDHIADPLQAERPQRLALVVLRPDLGPDLGDLEARHVRPPLRPARRASRPEPRPRPAGHGGGRPPPATRGASGRPRWRARC